MVEECTVEPPVRKFGVRHGQVILQFFFFIIINGIKMSLSGSIQQIMDSPDGDSNWTMTWISLAVSSYVFAFLVTGLFGGWVCKKCGFKWPMIITMVITSVVTLNLPLLTREYGHQGLLSCRIIQGLCAGLVYPMPADFVSRWIPVQERTVLGTTIYASDIIGNIIGMYMSTYLASTSLGWSFIYTQYGYLAIIWVILMAIFGADCPEEFSRHIPEDEVNYIVQNRGRVTTKSKVNIPWRQMLTSAPIWAIIVAQIGAVWLFSMSSGNVLLFVYAFYDTSMHSGVYLIVAVISWIFTFIFSGIAQLSINERKTTIVQSRKIFNTIGCFVPAVVLILFLVLPAWNDYEGIFLYTLLCIASVATIVGSKLNINDISSNFAPVIFGTANWIGNVVSVILTILITLPGIDSWTLLFLFTAVLLVLTNIFYLKFGSGEEQIWETYDDIRDEESELSKSTSRASNDEGKYLLFVRKQ